MSSEPEVVAEELVRSWAMVPPVEMRSPYVHGMSSAVWLAVDAVGDQVVAKLVYDEPSNVEAGLRAAELADDSGVRSGRPRRTVGDELFVMLETDRGEHPLAALEALSGDLADLSDPRVDERLGRLMGTIQGAIQSLDLEPYDGLLEYLSDESHEIAHGSVLWPAIRRVVSETADLALTWGVAYGDGPEPIDLGCGRARPGGLGLGSPRAAAVGCRLRRADGP